MWSAEETSSGSSNTSVQKLKVRIDSVYEQYSKSGYPCVNFEFSTADKVIKFQKKAPLSYKYVDNEKTDELYLPIRPGYTPKSGKNAGVYQPATLAYEIIQIVRSQAGDAKIDKRKEDAGGYNEKFFKGLEFSIDIKTVDTGETVFHIPMFEYERLREEEYSKKSKQEEADNSDLVEKALKEADTILASSDLPF